MQIDLTNDEYHARPELSRSQIMDWIESPELYYGRWVAGTIPKKEPSASMLFGSMIDDYLTLGIAPSEQLPLNVVEIPEDVLTSDGKRSGNKYGNWLAQQPDGVECWRPKDVQAYRAVQRDNFASCTRVNGQVYAHSGARDLLWHRGHPEGIMQPSYVFDRDGVACRCRPDLVIPGVAVVDIKTTKSVHPRKFAAAAYEYGYDVQAVMGVLGARQRDEDMSVYLIAIHNVPPYEVEVYEMPDDFLEIGYQRFTAAVAGIKRARENGNGPEQYRSDTHGQTVPLFPPSYLLKEFQI